MYVYLCETELESIPFRKLYFCVASWSNLNNLKNKAFQTKIKAHFSNDLLRNNTQTKHLEGLPELLRSPKQCKKQMVSEYELIQGCGWLSHRGSRLKLDPG